MAADMKSFSLRSSSETLETPSAGVEPERKLLGENIRSISSR